MSCSSCPQSTSDMKEGFHSGTPPYLGYSGFPGSDFPSQCGGGSGYGGYGHYGTYGGCATYDHYDIDNSKTGASGLGEHDEYSNVHEPGCWSPSCQQPYSMPYHAEDGACAGNCGGVKGECGCGNKVEMPMHDSGMGMDTDMGSLIDVGLTNGNGLKGHLSLPGFNIHVDFHALLRYAVLILIVSAIAYYLLGLRIR